MGWRWKHWIPACAGTTIQENMQQDVTFEHIHDNPLLKSIEPLLQLHGSNNWLASGHRPVSLD